MSKLRWRVLAGLLIGAGALGVSAVAILAFSHKLYHLPAESMAPTLRKGDRLVATRFAPGEIGRGDVLIVRAGGAAYVKRVAALPGDRIGMRDGIVILNGAPIPQRLLGTERIEGFAGPAQARRLAEQFPGEPRSHEIFDLGPTQVDELDEVTVPADHFFLLGDNRDMSADSRIPRSDMGLELVPRSDIKGAAQYFGWGSSRKMGERVSG